MNFFSGSVVLITGSSMGIGRELALQVLERGGSVMLNARGAQRLQGTLEELRDMFGTPQVDALAGDIADPGFARELVEATIKSFGKLNVLINNAGIAGEGALAKVNIEKQKLVVDVNLMGSIYTSHYGLPYLQATQGRLMLVSSLAGIHGLPGFSMYSVSKMALTALAESLRNETRRSGMRVGIAFVGFTVNEEFKTQIDARGEVVPLGQRAIPGVASRYTTARKILQQIAAGRFKQIHSIAGRLLYGLNRLSPGLVSWIMALRRIE